MDNGIHVYIVFATTFVTTMAESSQTFEQWIAEAELTPETCSILADNGFCSKKAIRRLTPVIMHKHFAKSLPLILFTMSYKMYVVLLSFVNVLMSNP